MMSRTVYLSVAQRYWNPRWTRARNRDVYKSEASPAGVGANLQVRISAAMDPQPLVMELKRCFDHRAFDRDFDVFAARASTLERIADFMFQSVEGRGALELAVSEDDASFVHVTPRGLSVWVKNRNLRVGLARVVDPGTGLAFDRGEVDRAVRAVAPYFAEPEDLEPWARRLYAMLASKLGGLTELHIDLGRQGLVRIGAHA